MIPRNRFKKTPPNNQSSLTVSNVMSKEPRENDDLLDFLCGGADDDDDEFAVVQVEDDDDDDDDEDVDDDEIKVATCRMGCG